MKTLVFLGAARKKGATREMVDMLLERIDGEVEIIDCYRTDVSPCIDCRYCWQHAGCAIKDEMQYIYRKIEEADTYIMAAPMYFHSIPGKMKVLVDRFQVYWAGMALRKDHPHVEDYRKKGVILMTGGAKAFPGQFDAGAKILQDCLGCFGATCVGQVTFSDTDHIRPRDDEATRKAMEAIDI